MELINKRVANHDKQQEAKFEQEMQTQITRMLENKINGGKPEQALILVNEAGDDMLKKRLKMLINKQFFELEKYLGTMYTQSALDKLIAKEKIKEKYKTLEEEACSTLSGERLVMKLNQLKEDEILELNMIDAELSK